MEPKTFISSDALIYYHCYNMKTPYKVIHQLSKESFSFSLEGIFMCKYFLQYQLQKDASIAKHTSKNT